MIQILEKLESSTQLDSEIDSKFKKVRTRYSTKNIVAQILGQPFLIPSETPAVWRASA